ncbi:MAG: pyridoxamine 5'-phosphate oxidase family protein, partial [Pseudomonadota bacterium]
IHDPRISLLFLIPGIGVTMRVNGRAHISKNPELIAQFDMNGKLPLTVVVTAVDRVYFQCPKALIRSRLWSAESHVDGTALPSTGTMLEALDANGLDGAQYDANYPARVKETIY